MSEKLDPCDASLNDDNDDEGPPAKRHLLEEGEDEIPGDVDLDMNNADESIENVLLNFSQVVAERFDRIESRLDGVQDFCRVLEEKVEMLSALVKEGTLQTYIGSAGSPGSVSSEEGFVTTALPVPVSGNVTLIALNTESDYPNGSWLGDENNPDLRVRCPVLPTDLFHINTNCQTAEKMALMLLDYLFDRETQACSNISGSGKYNKKQLDPLMIYGIRCHLIHRFNITSIDWNRIKQNLDSKCRTAFRRKQKGLPLTTKRQIGCNDGCSLNQSDDEASDSNGLDSTELPTFALQSVSGEMQTVMSEVIQTEHGEIRVVHATPEQLAHIQQAHQIQFVSEDRILSTLEEG